MKSLWVMAGSGAGNPKPHRPQPKRSRAPPKDWVRVRTEAKHPQTCESGLGERRKIRKSMGQAQNITSQGQDRGRAPPKPTRQGQDGHRTPPTMRVIPWRGKGQAPQTPRGLRPEPLPVLTSPAVPWVAWQGRHAWLRSSLWRGRALAGTARSALVACAEAAPGSSTLR